MEVFTGTEKNKHSNSLILSNAGSVCAPAPQRMAKSRLTNWKKECSWAKNRCSKTHGKIACCPIYKRVRQGVFQKIWGFKTFSATVPLDSICFSSHVKTGVFWGMQGLLWGKHLQYGAFRWSRGEKYCQPFSNRLPWELSGWGHASHERATRTLNSVKREEIRFPIAFRKHSPWPCPDLRSPMRAMDLEVLNWIRGTVPFRDRELMSSQNTRREGEGRKITNEAVSWDSFLFFWSDG